MKNIVTVGGGTGSYTVLSGLKNLPDISISALVSMADDGGSTGILRKKWHVMPAGDVRQCLAALSGKEFLNDRIASGYFKGHKIGNVLFAVLEKITCSFSASLEILSFIFNIKGKIIPITKEDSVLCVELSSGETIVGENNIDTHDLQSEAAGDLVKKVFYKKSVRINKEAEKAILAADFIIIGPGNIFCSILPNFITEGFHDAIKKSSAKIIFLGNLVNKQGHTMGWGRQKYLDITEKYLGKAVDFYLINKEEFSKEQAAQYRRDNGEQIFIKEDLADSRIIRENLLLNKLLTQDPDDTVKRSLIRHDSNKLKEVLGKIINS